jgi:hypothetical protein
MGQGGTWRLAGLALAILGCQDARPFEVERDDPQGLLIMATVDDADRLLDLRFYGPGEPVAAPLTLGPGGGQLLTLELSSEDLEWATPRRPVEEAELAQVEVRRSTEAPSAERGACGRCGVPSYGRLQQVTPGDRCLPLVHRARLYRPGAGALAPRGPEDLEPRDQATITAVQAALRIDWPGACPSPPAPAADWSVRPISPAEQLWPTRTFGQTVDGTVGVFGRELAGWFTTGGQKGVMQGPNLPFRAEPWAAVATSSVGAPARFVVFSPGPVGTVAHLFTAVADGFTITDAELEGPLPFAELVPQKARWHGDRVVIVGSFSGATPRPAVLDCQPTARGLRCAGPLIAPLVGCPGADPHLVDYTLTPRGVVAASANTFYYGSSLAEDAQWSCSAAPDQNFAFDGPISPVQAVEIGAVGGLGERVFACVQPPNLPVLALLAFDADPALGPFDDQPPVWSQIYRRGDGQCREIVPWPITGGETVRADLGVLFLERKLGATDEEGDWTEFYSQNEAGGFRVTPNGPQQLPVLRLIHRTPGWTMGSVGWFVEPEPVGAGLLIRPDRNPWRLLWDVPPHDDMGTVVIRGDDALAFNAFTDALPLRISDLEGPSPQVERLTSLRPEDFMREGGESISGGVHDPLSGQVYVFGHQLAPDDQDWAPFVRAISAQLDVVSRINLPLGPGDFLCDAALLEPGRILLVGGNGALLEVSGTLARRVPINFDDPETAEIEEPPSTFSDAIPRPHLYSVSAAGGVAWAVGRAGLILRIRPEQDGSNNRSLIAERVSLDRIGPDGLGQPLSNLPYFSHVVAAEANRVYVVAQRRPYTSLRGCAQITRDREPADQPQVLVVEENPDLGPTAQALIGDQIPRRLVLHTDRLPNDGTLPELAPSGAFLDGGEPVFLYWDGSLAYRDRSFPLPFAPLGADRSPNGTLVIVGPNGRIAIGRPN